MCKSNWFLLTLFAAVLPTAAATYHVDWDQGSDRAAGESHESAWKSPWHAAEKVAPGDTVIVHGRDDGQPYHRPTCQPVIVVNTPRTTWRAAEGEIVRFSSTSDFETAPWTFCGQKGSTTVYIDAPHTVFDGFHVWGSILINKDGDHARIENCDLSGGGDYQGFPAVIRTTGSPPNTTPDNWCDGLIVRHNRIHDNLPAMGQGSSNDTLLLTYGASNVVVEYNEFFGALSNAIRWKDRANKMTARYNLFRDQPIGIQGDAQVGIDWIATHDNVFLRMSRYAVAIELGAPTEFLIYNNTFVDNTVDIGWWHGLGKNLHIFNNVFAHSKKKQYYQFYDERWRAALFVFSDYNFYAGSERGTSWVLNNKTAATGLASWRKQLKGSERHSIEGPARFIGPQEGGRSLRGFSLAGEPLPGRGGDWPATIGARVEAVEIGPVRP